MRIYKTLNGVHIDLDSISAISEVRENYGGCFEVYLKLHDKPLYFNFESIGEFSKDKLFSIHKNLIEAWQSN